MRSTIFFPKFTAHTWQGAFWKILACFFFAANNGVVKLLSQSSVMGAGLSSYQISFLQNCVGSCLMLPFVLPAFIPSKTSSQSSAPSALSMVRPLLHFYRVLSAVAGVILWYMSLNHMPMTQAVALSFSGPLFTIVGARIYLKEKITVYRCAALVLGILGMFLIVRPDKAFYAGTPLLSWAILLPLGSAVALAFAKLLARSLSQAGETPRNLTFYLLFLMTPFSLIPAVPTWTNPSFEQWEWILVLGLLSTAAHYTTSHAYRLAEVTFLAPFGIARLIFTAMIGVFFFAESTQSFTFWVGSLVLIASSFCLGLENTVKREKKITAGSSSIKKAA